MLTGKEMAWGWEMQKVVESCGSEQVGWGAGWGIVGEGVGTPE